MKTNAYLPKIFPVVFFLSLITFGLIAYCDPGIDFRSYYGATLLIRRGGNPYDYAQLTPVLQEISGFKGNSPYFNPPWYALAFIPMTLLTFRNAQVLWIIINLGLFYVSLEWLWAVLEWEIQPWFRWVVFTFANILFGYAALISENSGFVLLFGLATTLRGLKREQNSLAGLGLVLMITKPQALIFTTLALAIWFLRFQPRVIAWATGWFVVFISTATLLFPRWWDFPRDNFGLGIRYVLDGDSVIVGKRVAATTYDWLHYFWEFDALALAIAATLIIALATWLLFITLQRTPDPLHLAAAATLLTLVTTPYTLQYDFVPLTLAYFLIAKHLPEMPQAAAISAVGLLFIAILIQFVATLQFQVYGIVLCIAGAFALAITARTPPQESQTP